MTREEQLLQAAQNAQFLYYWTIGGTLVISALWTLVRWRLGRLAAKARRAAIREELRQWEAQNPVYQLISWREFCQRNELSESAQVEVLSIVQNDRKKVEVV